VITTGHGALVARSLGTRAVLITTAHAEPADHGTLSIRAAGRKRKPLTTAIGRCYERPGDVPRRTSTTHPSGVYTEAKGGKPSEPNRRDRAGIVESHVWSSGCCWGASGDLAEIPMTRFVRFVSFSSLFPFFPVVYVAACGAGRDRSPGDQDPGRRLTRAECAAAIDHAAKDARELGMCPMPGTIGEE
jgi:hypothetical protein